MSNNTDTAAPSPSGLDAIQVLLTHDHELLNIRELGRLSICSREVATIFEQGQVWRQIFETWAQIGKQYQQGRSMFRSESYPCVTWNGESGLLECFFQPDEKVIARVGYKRALGCLLSKQCHSCGKMEARANPLTMHRICKECGAADETSYIISRSRAKEAFLLGEKEVKNLPSAAFASQTLGGKDCRIVVLLMADVKDAAFNKYGGADGLAAEFVSRTRAAAERYNKSQSTSKPQKKRPKIEKLSHRPADNVKDLAFGGVALPIGVAYEEDPSLYSHSSSSSKNEIRRNIAHSVTCKMCGSWGLASDIAMHERLEHGQEMTRYCEGSKPQPCKGPDDLLGPADCPGATQELVQLFDRSAAVTYARATEEVPFWFEDVIYNCNITLDIPGTHPDHQEEGKQVTTCVDKYTHYGEGCHWGGLNVCYQVGSKTVPFMLLHLGDGEETGQEAEASIDRFNDIIKALGLVETSAAQLLVMLMTRAMPLEEVKEIVSEAIPTHNKVPTLYAMHDIGMMHNVNIFPRSIHQGLSHGDGIKTFPCQAVSFPSLEMNPEQRSTAWSFYGLRVESWEKKSSHKAVLRTRPRDFIFL